MNNINQIIFPVFRAYNNGLTWIRIDSADHFTEVRKIGSRYEISQHPVRILPDRNHLQDLLFNYQPFAHEIGADDYQKVLVLASK